MDRREFLVNVFGTAVAAALPATPLFQPLSTTDWERAIMEVVYDHFLNLTLYGTAVIAPCDEFPFVQSVPPKELFATGGLLDVKI